MFESGLRVAVGQRRPAEAQESAAVVGPAPKHLSELLTGLVRLSVGQQRLGQAQPRRRYLAGKVGGPPQQRQGGAGLLAQ